MLRKTAGVITNKHLTGCAVACTIESVRDGNGAERKGADMKATVNGVGVAEFKRWMAREGFKLASEVLVKKAFAQLERERVDAYVEPIFAKYEFYVDIRGRGEERTRITHSDKLYQSKDEAQSARFFAELDEAHKAHGFVASGPGICPALSAEYDLTKAENALLKAAAAKFAFGDRVFWGEFRDKLLDILMGAAALHLKAA